jgi:aminocarboxymuconate-semialdehyde decarboxylase
MPDLVMTEAAIDVFCHALPPAYGRAVRRLATSVPFLFDRAESIPAMSRIDARQRVMDMFPGYRQVLSLASPVIETMATKREAASELAQIGNDALAQWCAEHPDRFAGFTASLSMAEPEDALAEAERAIRELGALGVQLYSNRNGRPLDETASLSVIEFVAQCDRAVWLHPIRPVARADYPSETFSKYDIWWVFGWPYETSVAMARLVFSGLFDRYPNLAVITHHVGGVVPMLEGRLDAGLAMLGTRTAPEHAASIDSPLRERPIDAFRRFYADTASFGSRATIACGLEFFGARHLMFGTDMPFDPQGGPGFIRATRRAIDDLDLSPEERRAILSGNAERVLRITAQHG